MQKKIFFWNKSKINIREKKWKTKKNIYNNNNKTDPKEIDQFQYNTFKVEPNLEVLPFA